MRREMEQILKLLAEATLFLTVSKVEDIRTPWWRLQENLAFALINALPRCRQAALRSTLRRCCWRRLTDADRVFSEPGGKEKNVGFCLTVFWQLEDTALTAGCQVGWSCTTTCGWRYFDISWQHKLHAGTEKTLFLFWKPYVYWVLSRRLILGWRVAEPGKWRYLIKKCLSFFFQSDYLTFVLTY